MCDYSLVGLINRLAIEGEDLTSFRLHNGSVGFCEPAQAEAHNKWTKDLHYIGPRAITGPEPAINPVCIPPGAQLTLENLPKGLRKEHKLQASELVTFDQLPPKEKSHRDAVKFSNGVTLTLQLLGEGVQAHVLSTAGSTEREPVAEFVNTR